MIFRLAVLKKSSDIFVALGEVPRCNFMRLGTCQKPWCVAMERTTKRSQVREKAPHEISGSTVQAWVMTAMADMILLPPSHPEIAVIWLANHPEQNNHHDSHPSCWDEPSNIWV